MSNTAFSFFIALFNTGARVLFGVSMAFLNLFFRTFFSTLFELFGILTTSFF